MTGEDCDEAAFERLPGDVGKGWLLLCDHASNRIPAELGDLGMKAGELDRHIAYDIGAAAVTRRLAARLEAPAVLSRFSRLVIDPNRGPDDPTLIMRLSDGAVVPGNARIGQTEIARRLRRYYAPYDQAIAGAIEKALADGYPPAIVSVHSFTPTWRGDPRPWHAGILWDNDPRLPQPLIEALRADPALTVGDNEPYSGELYGDTMYRHGTGRGLAHALVEIRQDLIGDAAGAEAWADRLGDILESLAGRPGLNEIRHYGSVNDRHNRDNQP